MERLAEKLKKARKDSDMNQSELSEIVGVSRRSITAYESGISVPRKNILRKLAQALNVTEYYLTHDEAEDTEAERRLEDHLNVVRDRFGNKASKEASELLERNRAFFAAGGDVDQESKDALFDALMEIYLLSKQEAHDKFTPKSKRKK